METKGNILDTNYAFLSIFIEFLSRREAEFDIDAKTNYMNKLEDVLHKTSKLRIRYRDLENFVRKRTNVLDICKASLVHLKPYYLKLLSSRKGDVRARVWEQVPDLITHTIIKTIRNKAAKRILI